MTSNKTKSLCISAVVIAMYIAIMYATQSFAFGAYQIRIATSLYSLSYLFPFLVIPLGLSNFLSNFLGGFGLADMLGGALVGLITSGAVFLIRKWHLPRIFIIPVIILGPGLIVPLWLSPLIGVPYPVLAFSLCVGQTPPAILGYALVHILSRTEIDKLWKQDAL